MLARATVAVAALFAVVLLLWGRSRTEQFFVAPARTPTVTARPRAPIVVLEGGTGDKPKTPKKGGFKAPAWMRQCEYAWDCDSPLICCEFVGASFCCGGGMPAYSPRQQPQMIPIPVPVPSPGYPQPNYPGNNRYPYP